MIDDRMNRRDLLRSGAAVGLGAWACPAPLAGSGGNVILLTLVGGPSHVDTWDMKPDAPSAYRGPFRPIATRVPGVSVSEIFPQLSGIMDRVSLVRSCHHDALPVHGDSLERMHPAAAGLPDPVLVPGPIEDVGGGRPVPPSKSAVATWTMPARDRETFGPTRFGRDCWRAARLVEKGTRFVNVNMGQTLFGEPSWDAHGKAPFGSLDAYRTVMGPMFDIAFSALILDLERSGLLRQTLVVAMGEFGRTPRINESGGRDHHPGCFTTLWAGGPVRGGRVVGASDAVGAEPRDRLVTPAEIHATLGLGLGLSTGRPITELL